MKTDFPGHLLRERRIELGLSTEDVFRKTRIPTQFIDALEGGNLDVLPSACFSLGFVKSYCRLIDLDANYYVDAFGAAAQPPARRFSLKDYKKLTTPRSMAGELIVWAAICVVLVAAWTVYSVVVRPETEPGQGSVQAGAVMIESDGAVAQSGH